MNAVVFVGPSLAADQVAALVPSAHILPPVRRGDLYRVRQRGADAILVLDGVFFQQDALPPREIIDVLDDGAWVLGAASLGALRAADCGPSGMLGSGLIFRWLRRGILGSDDEVAVVFDGESGEALSVPLVNVRWAASRCRRAGAFGRETADALVAAARALHYSERTWQAILKRTALSGASDDLIAELSRWDLKAEDARRAARTLAARLAEPRPGRPASTAPSRAWERPNRELNGAALGIEESQQVVRELARWHLVSGRCYAHLTSLAAAFDGHRLGERMAAKEEAASLLSQRFETALEASLRRPLALRLALVEIWAESSASEEAFGRQLWAELTLTGDLESEILRLRAIRDAAEQARSRGLKARPLDDFLATEDILQAHGLGSWTQLEQMNELTPLPWSEFIAYRRRLGLAKRFREVLFSGRPLRRGPSAADSPPSEGR